MFLKAKAKKKSHLIWVWQNIITWRTRISRRVWQKTLVLISENYLFNYYYQQQGLQELILSLKNYLEKGAIYAKENDILVTSGTQQALYILSQVSFPNKKTTISLRTADLSPYDWFSDFTKSSLPDDWAWL